MYVFKNELYVWQTQGQAGHARAETKGAVSGDRRVKYFLNSPFRIELPKVLVFELFMNAL